MRHTWFAVVVLHLAFAVWGLPSASATQPELVEVSGRLLDYHKGGDYEVALRWNGGVPVLTESYIPDFADEMRGREPLEYVLPVTSTRSLRAADFLERSRRLVKAGILTQSDSSNYDRGVIAKDSSTVRITAKGKERNHTFSIEGGSKLSAEQQVVEDTIFDESILVGYKKLIRIWDERTQRFWRARNPGHEETCRRCGGRSR